MKKRSTAKKILYKIITAAVLIGVWQAAASIAGLPLLLPSPYETLTALIGLAATSAFWLSIAHSLLNVCAGFLAGTFSGALICLLTTFCAPLREFFKPIIGIIKATPVASFIILALVWMKRAAVPAFTSSLIVIPVVWSNLSEGMLSADDKLLEAAKVYRMSWRKKMQYIYLPHLKSYFNSAATASIGMAWKAGVAAEVICTPASSIGKGIYEAKIYLDTPLLFAWTAAVIVMSVIIEKLLLLLLKRGHGNA